MFSRAERRHHKDRMKAKARRVAHTGWGYRPALGCTPEVIAYGERKAMKCADHLKACSGPCCANPRHNGWNVGRGSLAMQELRHVEDDRHDNPHAVERDPWDYDDWSGVYQPHPITGEQRVLSA